MTGNFPGDFQAANQISPNTVRLASQSVLWENVQRLYYTGRKMWICDNLRMMGHEKSISNYFQRNELLSIWQFKCKAYESQPNSYRTLIRQWVCTWWNDLKKKNKWTIISIYKNIGQFSGLQCRLKCLFCRFVMVVLYKGRCCICQFKYTVCWWCYLALLNKFHFSYYLHPAWGGWMHQHISVVTACTQRKHINLSSQYKSIDFFLFHCCTTSGHGLRND